MDGPVPQTIFIVGGTQGIGLSTAKAVLSISQSHPHFQSTQSLPTPNIFLFGLVADNAELQSLQEIRDSVYPFAGDITNPVMRNYAVEACIKLFRKIDTLIYSAGVITPIARIENMDMTKVEETFRVNVLGAMAMTQLLLPHLRKSRFTKPLNAAHGKILILTSACDSSITYHGWTPYCTSKAALTRFISCLAHEEPTLSVQGVYPKLSRTGMPKEIIAGSFRGVMADHEIERFRVWNEIGDEMVEPPERCGEAVAKLALGLVEGGRSGETLYYDEHVPRKVVGT